MAKANAVAHFEIYGDEPARLATFYEELFGWKIEKSGQMDYWNIRTVATDSQGHPTETGGINGGLMKRMAGGPSWLNYVTVPSLEEALSSLKSLGGTVVRPKTPVPQMGWFAIVTDPEKNAFGIWQDDPKAA